MSVPTHGYDCQTLKYYKTTCSYCRNNVFYFECSCGSKVFLDGNGFQHDCGNLPKIRTSLAKGETLSNLDVVKRLVVLHNRKGKRRTLTLTPADFHQLWMEYLYSLEWFNLCGSCQKPIKTRAANIEHKFFGENTGKAGIQEKISRYADIAAHYEIVDLKDNSIFNPFCKYRIRYKFVEKYRVTNLKCNCPFKERRKLNRN